MPPTQRPLRLEAAILSRMRSEVTSRSNWANDSSTFSVSRPIEVVVLNCWVTDTNDTLCWSNSSTSLAKSASDRVNRSTLGQFTSLSYSGPRHCVWRGLQAAVACHGHSGQADCSPIAVAEPVRRETDRHDPTGMSRPHNRIWGGAPAPDPGSVCRVL